MLGWRISPYMWISWTILTPIYCLVNAQLLYEQEIIPVFQLYHLIKEGICASSGIYPFCSHRTYIFLEYLCYFKNTI